MREHLFRGKRVDTKEWIEGYFVIDGAERNLITVPKDGAPVVTFYPAIPRTVGRFTGLTDKSGKKIFEGGCYSIQRCLCSYQIWRIY